MLYDVLNKTTEYRETHRRKRLWLRIVSVLAAIVVFCTSYALILPAVTQERDFLCGYTEHSHTVDCYAASEKVLICDPIHKHTAECIDSEGSFVCGKAEYPLHTHGDECRTNSGTLICDLPELEAHTHGTECFAAVTVPSVTTATLQSNTAVTADEPTGSVLSEESTTDSLQGEDDPSAQAEETLQTVLLCTREEYIVHIHTSACFDETGTWSCGAVELCEHVHTDECCAWTDASCALLCELEEHQHSDRCYIDRNADTETAKDWEATLPSSLSGNRAEDLVAVGESQLGYHESTINVNIAEDGTAYGYTRYGAWYGDAYADWNTLFAAFCLYYANIRDVPLDPNAAEWSKTLTELGYFEKEGYSPGAGDILFLDTDENGEADRLALIGSVSNNADPYDAELNVIEGDYDKSVQEITYNSNDPCIVGYASFGSEEEKGDVSSESVLMEQTLTATVFTDGSYLTEASDETVITVSGSLPLGATVKAFPVDTALEHYQVICAYDISIFDADGERYDVQSPVTVSYALLQEADASCGVYYLPNEGDPVAMDSTNEQHTVQFTTNHFSVYALLAADITVVNTQTQLEQAISRGDEYIQLSGNFGVYIKDDEGDGYGALSACLTPPSGSSITLDLNGHTLWQNGSDALFNITNGASLTLIDSTQTEPICTNGDGDVYGNTATVSVSNNTATLTYYVTETEITDALSGATKETLKRYTVSSKGMIVANDQPTFTVSGGTLNIASGLLCNGTGRALEITGGTVNLQGGYIAGYTKTSTSTGETAFGGAVRMTGGSLNLSGTVLAANRGHNGGALYAKGSASLSVTGGVISGNTATRAPGGWSGHSESGTYRCGGGGIYLHGNAVLQMSGGYLTNNHASDNGYFDGGGGIFCSGSSAFELNGGYVTGNTAAGGGGIRTDFNKSVRFDMNGGFVSGNATTDAEGAGIAIDRGGVASIYAGHITNNSLLYTYHWGGGGLFCADGATIYLKNLLVTDNDAGGFGGGVAGCPTGHIYLYVSDGCAVYGNNDVVDGTVHYVDGGNKDGIDTVRCDAVFQAHGHADYFCAFNSNIQGQMLGGYPAGWEGSADGVAVDMEQYDVVIAQSVMGLQAHPTEEAIAAAQAEAAVYIVGNYSYTHGGGIMCNGNLIIGEPSDIIAPAALTLSASKTVDNQSDDQLIGPENFSFILSSDEEGEQTVSYGVCDENGTIRFENLIFEQAGTYEYYLREQIDSTRPEIVYDETVYRLTVTVELSNTGITYGECTKYVCLIKKIVSEKRTDGSWQNVKTLLSDDGSEAVTFSPVQEGAAAFTNLQIGEKTYGLHLTKVSDRDPSTVLAGAQFTLLDSNGQQLFFDERDGAYYLSDTDCAHIPTTDENGKLSFYGLPSGSYTLRESKAPDGYGVIDDMTVTVGDDGEPIVYLTIEDPFVYSLPQTGSCGTYGFTFGGCFLMLFALGCVGIRRWINTRKEVQRS